jgi:hypothetical protein
MYNSETELRKVDRYKMCSLIIKIALHDLNRAKFNANSWPTSGERGAAACARAPTCGRSWATESRRKRASVASLSRLCRA